MNYIKVKSKWPFTNFLHTLTLREEGIEYENRIGNIPLSTLSVSYPELDNVYLQTTFIDFILLFRTTTLVIQSKDSDLKLIRFPGVDRSEAVTILPFLTKETGRSRMKLT